jgi:hypothetical protein
MDAFRELSSYAGISPTPFKRWQKQVFLSRHGRDFDDCASLLYTTFFARSRLTMNFLKAHMLSWYSHCWLHLSFYNPYRPLDWDIRGSDVRFRRISWLFATLTCDDFAGCMVLSV